MSPFQRMQEHQEHFTKNDRKIYDTLLKDPGGVAFASTSKLAELCGVSQPAVTRFVKSLGYDRYQDFRAELVSFLARNSDDGVKSGRQRYFSNLHATLNEAEDLLTPEYMRGLADYVRSFDRLFVTGLGKSTYPAELFSLYVRKLGIVATYSDLEAAKDFSDLMTERDMMMIFTVNGQPKFFNYFFTENRGALMIVTAAYHTKKLRTNDRLVALPYLTTNAEESPISPVLFSVFVELLVDYMSR